MSHQQQPWFYMKSFDSEAPDILFCDNHVLIAAKPAGLLTQPDKTDRPSLEGFAKDWVKKQYKKPGNVFLHCIHRIDRPVSGLVIFARTSKALSRLNELSRAKEIRRFYRAEVEGILSQKEGTLEHYLIHGEHRALLSKEGSSEAKKATLTYRVHERKEHSTLVDIELDTGRYHQIRAQLSAIGHPVLGDKKYGSKIGDGQFIHLTCTDLQFPHPVTKELLSFHFDTPF
jgi:23S rRNA pseudouridine1911/1915/1917 synthase